MTMIDQAERRGGSQPGTMDVDYASRRTGSSPTSVCAARGYRLRLVSSDAAARFGAMLRGDVEVEGWG